MGRYYGKRANLKKEVTRIPSTPSFSKNELFLPRDMWGKKRSFLPKIWRAWYSCYLRFDIRPFAIVPTNGSHRNYCVVPDTRFCPSFL